MKTHRAALFYQVLHKLADKYKDRPFSYLWAGAGQQAQLEENFGVGGFGYPALVAFKPRDLKYSVAKSAFELEHVVEVGRCARMNGCGVPGVYTCMYICTCDWSGWQGLSVHVCVQKIRVSINWIRGM